MKKEKALPNKQNIYSWFPLDNLAKIFPSNLSSRLTTLFRLTAILKTPIHITYLQKAFDNMLNRCPYYKVQLRRGFFWYFFESNPIPPKIMAEVKYPCMNMKFKKNGVLPLRVRAFKNRITVEFSHILTDGTGALVFLKSLVAEYLKLTGVEIEDYDGILQTNETPDKNEWDDSFKNLYQKDIPTVDQFREAFHLPYRFIEKGKYIVTTGIVSVSEVIKIAKEKNVTLTELLVALYFDVLQEIYLESDLKNKQKMPIRISIPVNLRHMHNSITMRNFFLAITLEIDPRLGKFTFDEILKRVYHYMQVEIDQKNLSRQIKRNLRGEVHPLIRSIPLFFKNIGLSFIYNYRGDNQTTTNLSNMGKVELPDCIADYIHGFEIIPPPNPKYKVSCTMISFKDRLSITFGRLIKESRVEELFFTKLVNMGINVKINTNIGC